MEVGGEASHRNLIKRRSEFMEARRAHRQFQKASAGVSSEDSAFSVVVQGHFEDPISRHEGQVVLNDLAGDGDGRSTCPEHQQIFQVALCRAGGPKNCLSEPTACPPVPWGCRECGVLQDGPGCNRHITVEHVITFLCGETACTVRDGIWDSGQAGRTYPLRQMSLKFKWLRPSLIHMYAMTLSPLRHNSSSWLEMRSTFSGDTVRPDPRDSRAPSIAFLTRVSEDDSFRGHGGSTHLISGVSSAAASRRSVCSLASTVLRCPSCSLAVVGSQITECNFTGGGQPLR